MRVQIVDPPAYTPPYDRALCAALARAGAEVELITSRFVYGPVPEPEGYRVDELFYRRRRRAAAGSAPAAPCAPPGTWRTCCGCAASRDADVVHLQWPVPASTAAVAAADRG